MHRLRLFPTVTSKCSRRDHSCDGAAVTYSAAIQLLYSARRFEKQRNGIEKRLAPRSDARKWSRLICGGTTKQITGIDT